MKVTRMDNTALAELVTKASNGCQDSMGLLTEQFQDDLYRYIYRLTLNQSLTEDIRQETLLQMCKSLGSLRNVNNIKGWLFKTAWGKAMNHYRSTKKHRHMSIHENNLVSDLESKRIEGLKTLISKEIAETLVQSISQLGVRQRSVLVLRCYENLHYAEIASIMNCSETAARILFFRAKNKLRQRLDRKGVTWFARFVRAGHLSDTSGDHGYGIFAQSRRHRDGHRLGNEQNGRFYPFAHRRSSHCHRYRFRQNRPVPCDRQKHRSPAEKFSLYQTCMEKSLHTHCQPENGQES